jgi:2-dehydro-3-deoxygluconokinase
LFTENRMRTIGKPPTFRAAGQVIAVGECMVELARSAEGGFNLGYGGDTFNAAVYLVRAGVPVTYATALGDDPYSAGIRQAAEREGVATDLMATLPGRMPGLYMIETAADGERSFWYWRDRAAARDLFECDQVQPAIDAIIASRAVYFSGITLALYGARGLDRFAAALVEAGRQGTLIVMDSNYRPRGWSGDRNRARATYERFWRLAHVALPTFDDEQALWGDADPAATIDRLSRLGVGEIIVKNGPAGALVSHAGSTDTVPCPTTVAPVDTTAAGDSFNAAYLARRLAGDPPATAARFGHRLAAVVIQHRGAIVPAAATAEVLRTA